MIDAKMIEIWMKAWSICWYTFDVVECYDFEALHEINAKVVDIIFAFSLIKVLGNCLCFDEFWLGFNEAILM